MWFSIVFYKPSIRCAFHQANNKKNAFNKNKTVKFALIIIIYLILLPVNYLFP